MREQVSGAIAHACIDFWASEDLPLVVTRQPAPVPCRQARAARPGPSSFARSTTPAGSAASDPIAVGLPAPDRWRRLRLGLVVPGAAIRTVEAFPGGERVGALLPPEARPAWHTLLVSLAALDAAVRVHGSYGWQCLTGLDDHIRAGSDLDLCIDVRDDRHADRVVALLQSWDDRAAPRLDGELAFDDGSAVAWREWERWRAGAVAQILVRDLHALALHGSWPFRAARPSPCGQAT